jgi:periplasmic divalent cation tolerance protein
MEAYIQVATTTENKQDAERIAKALVERRLAACVQLLGPVVSTYWWKNNIETAQEWLCYIKTRKALYDEVEEAIKGVHPYETPEIIAMPIVAGSDDYLDWLNQELRVVTGRG